MTFDNLTNCTPADIAMTFDAETIHRHIGYNTGLDIDSLANMLDNSDITNSTVSDMTDNLEDAFTSWYDREGIPRPDYTPAELAADIAIYTAWQLKTTNREYY